MRARPLILAIAVASIPAGAAPRAQPAAPSSAAPAHRPAHPPARAPVVRPHHPAGAKAAPAGKPAAAGAAAAAAGAAAVATEPPVAAAPTAAPPDPAKGTDTGLPLPRWASLRTDEVNLRAGPGTRYPIDWVYKRRDLPVRVVREFEKWRLVVDQEDTKGWVHQATLVTRRDFVVTGGERILREAAREDAPAVARLAAGVVGRIRGCAAGAAWCEVQTGDYRGWLKRDEFWGTAPGEAVQ